MMRIVGASRAGGPPWAPAAAVVGTQHMVSVAWLRYGRALFITERDGVIRCSLLFMPTYEIREHHEDPRCRTGRCDAGPSPETSKCWLDLPGRASLDQGARLIIGATPDRQPRPACRDDRGRCSRSVGRVLADVPDRRDCSWCALTRPWEMPNVVFRAVPPGEFASFSIPRLREDRLDASRVDPIDGGHSIFSTETRAIATDPSACSSLHVMVVPLTRNHPYPDDSCEGVENGRRTAGPRGCGRPSGRPQLTLYGPAQPAHQR